MFEDTAREVWLDGIDTDDREITSDGQTKLAVVPAIDADGPATMKLGRVWVINVAPSSTKKLGSVSENDGSIVTRAPARMNTKPCQLL